jgi:dTDP-4-amino-4,6-dideoxygalactose transaminase
MSYFLKLKKKYGIFLIEDAAHSFMGKYKNQYLGTIGDIGAFSFHETKNLVGGQCGAISINNLNFSKKVKIILDKGTDRSFINNKKKYYSWRGVGSEYRATELSSALLFGQFAKLNKIQNLREKIWNKYNENFSKLSNKNVYFLKSKHKFKKSAYHVFALIFRNIKLRDNFILFMKKKGIDCYFHYYPLHMSKFGRKIKKIKLPETEKTYNGLVRLPLYP